MALEFDPHRDLVRGPPVDLPASAVARAVGEPAAVVARVQQADTLELEQWADRILDATSLEDMFAERG